MTIKRDEWLPLSDLSCVCDIVGDFLHIFFINEQRIDDFMYIYGELSLVTTSKLPFLTTRLYDYHGDTAYVTVHTNNNKDYYVYLKGADFIDVID